ncbi:MAG: hypothetical protein LBH73_02925 [Spirochaetaceae bacterium]|jgi:hypothetical protein|nr:hypothetical protein [Spirochaetaceae bacterium]
MKHFFIRNLVRNAALVLFLCSAALIQAGEFSSGFIKLVLHERSGRFSLYYLTDAVNRRYEPLFADQDPRTSFLSVMVDDRAYKLGEASAFKIRLREGGNPALVFESAFLTVTEEFLFTRSENSEHADGISIVVRAENKSNRASRIGLRFFLDTNLGEGERGHFTTDRRPVEGEFRYTGENSDLWWASRNRNCGFFGGLSDGADEVIIGNWKRLNDAAWKISVQEGRNFNLLPYSVNDSAVAYYFEPVSVAAGDGREGRLWFSAAKGGEGIAAAPLPRDTLLWPDQVFDFGGNILSLPGRPLDPGSRDTRADLTAVQELITRIDGYITSGTITEEELSALELGFQQLKAPYDRQ